MKRIFATMLCACIFLASLAIAEELPLNSTGSVQADLSMEEYGIYIVGELSQGQGQSLYELSTQEMREALGSEEGYSDMWEEMLDLFGAFVSVLDVEAGTLTGYEAAYITCLFESAQVVIVVLAEPESNLIASLVISDVVPLRDRSQETGNFLEEEIRLRPGEVDETHGLLTLPTEGEGPFPAVILLHGSGSSDMDESMLAHAPFSDIARGLAQLGIAGIRYDKYPYAHAELVGEDFDIQKEYVNDALEAAKLLLEDERIGEIYVLGHSLGAMVAPRAMEAIQMEAGDVLAGDILLAGTPLHLWEVQYIQNQDSIALMSDEEMRTESAQIVEAELLKLDSLFEMTDEELMLETFFGVTAYYQMDEMRVDAAETAAELALPLFIAQGAKDWQVKPEDGIELWQETLSEALDVTYNLYPDMNHLLADMQGEPSYSTMDYLDPDASVSQQLIEDIAAWIFSKA